MTVSAKNIIIAILIAVALGFTAKAVFFGESEKQKIFTQLDELKELLNKEEGETPIRIGLDSQKLSKYFSNRPVVVLGDPLDDANSDEELATLFQYVKRSVDTMDIKILRKDLTIGEKGKTAEMALTIRARLYALGKHEIDERDFQVSWIKEEKVWKIKKVDALETIHRPETY